MSCLLATTRLGATLYKMKLKLGPDGKLGIPEESKSWPHFEGPKMLLQKDGIRVWVKDTDLPESSMDDTYFNLCGAWPGGKVQTKTVVGRVRDPDKLRVLVEEELLKFWYYIQRTRRLA